MIAHICALSGGSINTAVLN